MTNKDKTTYVPTKLHARATSDLEEEVARELAQEDNPKATAALREAIESEAKDE